MGVRAGCVMLVNAEGWDERLGFEFRAGTLYRIVIELVTLPHHGKLTGAEPGWFLNEE